MNPSIEDALDALRVIYLDGGELALLLDYDGTLTPIVARPEQAVLAPEVRRLLQRLADLPRVHLGVVSGRKLDELKTLVDLPGLCYAGAAGMELELGGKRVVHPRAETVAAATAELIERIEEPLAKYPGAWIEDKRFACTVHYREVAPERIDRLRACVEEIVRREDGGARIVEGPMALEVAPALGWNKGTAVRAIVDHLDAPPGRAMIVYAGDGGNDADAFEAVAAAAGITIGVGPDAPSTARFHLPDTAALHDFLFNLAAALS
ncbi:MAG: trehalose-phosphatase [Pirellulales bacterium]|nr:trehalose-phosphatase [Pirellulales bacterium]